ncbi:MAG: chemotaxis protein CheW [Polyangiaceae bacterium]|nr:chemotaxis protein CheW [Polyangiaceae bacterium]
MVNSRGSRQLGRRAQAAERGGVTEFLALRLGSEIYGVPLTHVREILVAPPLTQVPRAPHDVLGIINVRGHLVTVIDLKRRLGLPDLEPPRKGRVLLVPGPEGELLGLSVDEVLQVYRLSESEIEPAGVLGGNVAEHVAGIGRRDGALLILLSPRALLGGAA